MSIRTSLSLICLLFYWLIMPGDSTASEIEEQLSWKRCYDDQGRITQSIDPAGRITQYSYITAANGNLQSVTMTPPEGSPVTWRFNDDGLLATMNDGEGEVVFRYDNGGRLTAIERVGAPAIRYSYDDADRITELRIGDFYRIAWTYDFLGRIAAIETPAGRIVYEYQAGQGMVVRSLPNGVKTIWKRQANGELAEITHGYFKKPADETYTLLAKYTYAHGPDGRIAAIQEQSGQGEFVRRYTYDTMGRLTGATERDGREYGYEYDIVGNRTRATATGQPDQMCTYDWAGRLTNVDGKPCTFDPCGNLTEVTLNGVTRQYRFHPDGRLAEVQLGGETVQYRYDGFGRLIARKTTAGETWFIPNPLSSFWQPLVMEETNGKRTLVIWDGDVPLALVRDRQVEWLLNDHLGSVRLITDAKGDVVHQQCYAPFGELKNAEQSATQVPGFAGLFWDELANGYSSLFRNYVPEVSSFLQPDPRKSVPSAAAGGCSFYTYCDNDPVDFIDRDGSVRQNAETDDLYKRPLWLTAFAKEHELYMNYAQAALMEGRPFRAFAFTLIDAAGELAWSVPQNIIRNWAKAFDTSLSGSERTWGVIKGFGHLGLDLALAAVPQKAVNSPKTWFIERGHSLGSAKEKFHFPFLPTNSLSKAQTDWFVKRFPQFKKVVDNRTTGLLEIRDLFGNPHFGVSSSKYAGQFNEHIAIWGEHFYRNGFYSTRWGKEAARLGYGKLATQLFKQAAPFVPPAFLMQTGTAEGSVSPSANFGFSPVGGVYLGGAGQLIEGLGSLKGVRIDDNGSLFLISEEQGDVKLPPLRIDDVVTVFRSVYLYGEGPTVTIDPNPEDPEKSAMIIRHGAATEETYVGWVLYQADRLMKSYTQGVDNITQKNVVSRIPDYIDVVNTIYFGAGDPRTRQKGGIWERFWIVPAETRRFEGARRELTLFDVPLKVKTQKMRWEQDKLVDDLTGKSSPGATAFTSWFTANYDSIAAEQYLTPPAESGITTPVPVFAELRRIALMTAIAEKLRDHNVPLPFWMHDYEVRKVPFEKFTPGLEATWRRIKGGNIETARIFGGVQLSADSKAIRTYTATNDVKKALPKMQAELDRSIKLANNLEQAIADVDSPLASVPLTMQQFETNNQAYQVVSVPGAETKELGPCHLDEIDIVVPVEGGNDIQLPRSYNSFFNPRGPWGQGWAFDLPRLVEIRVPVDRESDSYSYAYGYELITPLNSLQARFLNEAPVLGFSNPRSPILDQSSPFCNLTEDHPPFFKDVATRLLTLKNGQEWHFTMHGDLAAVKDGPQITVYERGTEGEITRIVSLFGGQPAGEIKLEYGVDQKLIKAVGASFDSQPSPPIEVIYAYDDANRLTGVSSEQGMIGYRYEGTWVSAITWQDRGDSNQAVIVRSFQYNPQGQMLSETADSVTIVHTITRTPNGLIASSRVSQGGGGMSGLENIVAQYDQHRRPTRLVTAEGDSTIWSYPASGGVEMTIKTPDQQSLRVIDAPDRSKRVIERNGFPWITAQLDNGGRLSHLTQFGRPVLTQEWRPDGQLASAKTAVQGAFFNYDSQGLLSTIVLHPANASENAAEWQQTRLDRKGRPVEVSDYTGLRVHLSYDRSGAPVAVVQQTPEGNYGYQISRDEQDRIDTVKSSWGNTVYNYNDDGTLQGIITTRGDRSAAVELLAGRVSAMTGFDSSRTSFEYHPDGPVAGLPRSILCPDGLKLDYEYDANGRLSTVKVGADRRVRLEYDPLGRMTTYAWEHRTGSADTR